ncbi:hypothetical protein RB195_007935 [Necator americanus]|uniref:Uncharacterized protein n=1 Tax=Necator americanus TaxID=51031 RepID=A0ABR1C209_NECAM
MRLLFLLLGGLHAPLVVEAMGLWAHEELNEMMMTGRPEHSAQLAVISLRAENEEDVYFNEESFTEGTEKTQGETGDRDRAPVETVVTDAGSNVRRSRAAPETPGRPPKMEIGVNCL